MWHAEFVLSRGPVIIKPWTPKTAVTSSLYVFYKAATLGNSHKTASHKQATVQLFRCLGGVTANTPAPLNATQPPDNTAQIHSTSS